MGYNWSTHQLTEFFTAITRSGDVGSATALAVERAAEATEAEIGAVVVPDAVLGCLGLGQRHDPEVFRAVGAGNETLTVDGLGTFHTTTIALGSDVDGSLVLGRLQESFQPEERQMLRGMAQVLGLAMRSLRTLDAERGLRREREQEAEQRLVLLQALERRESLLETLLQIQRAVSQRAPLQVVLDSVTRGASDLLNGALVALVLREGTDADVAMVLSIAPGHGAERHDARVLAAAAQVMAADHAVAAPPGTVAPPAPVDDHGSLIAAPVHVGGVVAGGLVIGSSSAPVRTEERRDVLAAFAEQASLALTDAHTVQAVREAYHDGLTGLPNRVLFLERSARALETAGRDGTTFTVLFIDLDLFKQVNDTLGHAAGDELLRGVAARLRTIVRDGDMTARLGGDEFAVLLESAGTAEGIDAARRIIAALEQPFVLGGREAFIGASVGIAVSDRTYASAEDLIQDADMAMYRAKKNRPGTLRVFEPSMRTDLLEHVELGTDVQHALTDGQLSVAYQPIVTLSGGRLVAVEALARWTHPRFGAVQPSTFVPLAEGNGFIRELGRWMLRESCGQLARWRAGPLPTLAVSVNVSRRQLEDDQLLDDVGAALALSGVPASALVLEVTDTALMRDPEAGLRRLGALRRTGVRLAIDDFGSGHSSLSQLHRLPVDQIKLDRSLVAGLGTDRRSRAIARSVVELGRTLGIETVAKGIEEAAQLREVVAVRCALGQGYLFAEPLDACAVPSYAGGPLVGSALSA
jgi:diguanylate cyclase (GGDEF)-like protein